MTSKLWTVLAALAVGACAAGGRVDAPQPVVAPLHSEFSGTDVGGSDYGPFVAATLAQQDENYARAARYYLEALKVDPDSRFVADRAFFQLLYAGRIDEAATVADGILKGARSESDDLLRLSLVLQAFKRQDWPTLRARLADYPTVGFGFLLTPLMTAWSYAAEGDEAHARTALKPLLDDPRLKTIGEEHLAFMLDHLHQVDAAQALYLSLLEGEKSTSVQVMVAYAHMLYREGRAEEARAFLADRTKRYPGSQLLLREAVSILSGEVPSQDVTTPVGAATAVFLRLAGEFAGSHSPKAAILYLRLAAYLSPGSAEISVMLGDLFLQVDDATDALAAYSAVAPTSPYRRLADMRSVQALEAEGRVAAAETQARTLLRSSPGDAELLKMLADILRGREDFAEAAVHYSSVISQLRTPGTNDWFVFFSRGVCYERLGDWDKAEGDMLTALRLNPGEASVLNYLGYSWIDRGVHIDEAKQLIAKAAKERPNDGFIVDSYGWVHYLTGDYRAAVELLEKAVRLEPTDATINDHLGDAYWRVGRRLEARFQWRHALTGKPEAKEEQALRQKLSDGLPDAS